MSIYGLCMALVGITLVYAPVYHTAVNNIALVVAILQRGR